MTGRSIHETAILRCHMGWSWDDYVPFFMKLGGHIDWLNGICLSNSTDFFKSYFGGFLSYVVISPVPFPKDGSGQQNWHHLCMLIMGQSMGQPDNRWLITSWTETSTWWCVLPGDDGDALGKWEWLFHGILCAIGSWVWTWWTMNISPVKKKHHWWYSCHDWSYSTTGWWFGPWLLWFSHHIGNVIIPTDERIYFSEGKVYHQPV